MDFDTLQRVVVNERIRYVVHNVAIMSVKGEQDPSRCLDMNLTSVRQVLELCRRNQLRCFIPSTIAVFGSGKKVRIVNDDTYPRPQTVYGITKVFMEQLGTYYNRKYGLQFRSLRYPGLISSDAPPGGGSTDYAIHMYKHAARLAQGKTITPSQRYACPLHSDQMLPMMHMCDAVRGTIQLLMAPQSKLTRCVYNIDGPSFTPSNVVTSIRKNGVKSFAVTYSPGCIEQQLAETWPGKISAAPARRDFGWEPKYSLDAITRGMLRDFKRMDI